MAIPVPLPPTLHWRPLPAPFDITSPAASARTVTVTSAVPCRRCLRDAQPGEQVVLLSYDPFLGSSPYRGATAIYVHADDKTCRLADVRDVVPAQQATRQLAVRAFSKEDMLVGFEVVEGGGGRIVGVCERLLGEEGVEYLHLHYAAPGCFAVRVEKGMEG